MRRRSACAALLVTLPVSAPAGAEPDNDTTILGVDLSYVNEMEDCGATYSDGTRTDPVEILAAHGANLVRARLWHDAEWTDYSTVDDVIRTFQRAQAAGMQTLLDFHYSDEWADPSRQNPPAAWEEIADVDELAAALGEYTTDTLQRLNAAGVLPDMVQVGNEINSGLVNGAVGLDWEHDKPLLEAGVDAVRAVSTETGQHIDVVIHVAQPENALDWFEQAAEAGLADFDVIGLSYYPQWSRFTVEELGSTVQSLYYTYGKDVLVVEAGYPWTHDDAGDTADNALDQASRNYDVSPEGQAAFMTDLTSVVVANGGLGTVYWEPAWISTDCRTRWGQGSHWENATLFDLDGALHAGVAYLGADYSRLGQPDEVEVDVADTAGDTDDRDADLTHLASVHDEVATAVAATIGGDVRQWPGSVILAIDNADGGGGDGGRRPYEFADDSRPELLLETTWNEDPGVGYASTTLHEWGGGEWVPRTFTGRVTLLSAPRDTTQVLWVLPAGLVDGNAAVTVMTARRGRAGELADVFDPGTVDAPVAMSLHVDEQP